MRLSLRVQRSNLPRLQSDVGATPCGCPIPVGAYRDTPSLNPVSYLRRDAACCARPLLSIQAFRETSEILVAMNLSSPKVANRHYEQIALCDYPISVEV